MDMLKLLYLCIMALYVHADAEKQSKQNRGRGSIWWYVVTSFIILRTFNSFSKRYDEIDTQRAVVFSCGFQWIL